jgi:hypothetical protein
MLIGKGNDGSRDRRFQMLVGREFPIVPQTSLKELAFAGDVARILI